MSTSDPTEQALQDSNALVGARRNIVITGLLLGMFFSALDQTVVGTAMPTIIGQLGHIELLTWITTAYLLTSTTVVPIAGKLADLFGRRSLYLIGMILFMIGSVLCGMADSMWSLAVYRGIQGIGAGMLQPLSMTIVGDITTGSNRAKMMGMFMGVFALSSVLGPQFGGWIVDHWSWHWVFYINLPFGVLSAIFIAVGLHGTFVPKKVTIDWLGILTLTIGVVALLLGMSLGGKQYAWNSWEIITLFIVSAVFLICFCIAEQYATDPILSLRLFKNRVFTVVNLVGFLMSLGMFGAITFIPLFMQGVEGMSATKASSVMTPMMLGMIIASLLGVRLLIKIGLRAQLIIGLAIMAAGFVLYGQMGLNTTRLEASIDMVVSGLGMGLIMPSLNIAIQEAFPAEVRGTVTAATTFFRSIGGTIGVALLGAVFNSRSVTVIGNQLDPIFSRMGTQGAKLLDEAHNNPQGLYSSLLNSAFLDRLPKAVVNLFQNQVTPILKSALLDSLHQVYSVSLWFILIGLVVALFTGKVKVTGSGMMKPSETVEISTSN